MSAHVRTKYVMIETPHLPGLPLPILLPETLQHELAKKLGTPMSAGFVERDSTSPCGLKTYGFSTSLNLSPAPRDAEFIARWLADLVHGAPTPSHESGIKP